MSPESPASSRALTPIVLAFLLLVGCRDSGELSGYVVASPAERGAITSAVSDYYRSRNALAGAVDVQPLWRTYPALERDRDPRVGISVELEFVERTPTRASAGT